MMHIFFMCGQSCVHTTIAQLVAFNYVFFMFSLSFFYSSFLEAETTTQLTQTSGGDDEITFPIQTCTRAGDVGWPSG